MFFVKKEGRRSGFGITQIFRLILSLFMMSILGLGLFQAYKYFSGVDPLTVSPKSLIKNIFNTNSAYQIITGLLTLNPAQSLEKVKEILKDDKSSQNNSQDTQNRSGNGILNYRFAIVSDSHTDPGSLAKALSLAKEANAKFVIGLGDYSDIGTVEELKATKNEFDRAGLTYYLVPGDHDLWDSRNKGQDPSNEFTEIFNTPPYQAFTYQNTRFILVYNSDNYIGLDELQLKWIDEQLDLLDQTKPDLAFVLTAIPLFHPSSDHVMGKTNPKLKNQAEHLSSIFKRHGVAEVFAGDTHFFSRYKEPTDDLPMTSVGAATSVRNPQAPRFVLVDIFEGGGYNVQDTEIR